VGHDQLPGRQLVRVLAQRGVVEVVAHQFVVGVGLADEDIRSFGCCDECRCPGGVSGVGERRATELGAYRQRRAPLAWSTSQLRTVSAPVLCEPPAPPSSMISTSNRRCTDVDPG